MTTKLVYFQNKKKLLCLQKYKYKYHHSLFNSKKMYIKDNPYQLEQKRNFLKSQTSVATGETLSNLSRNHSKLYTVTKTRKTRYLTFKTCHKKSCHFYAHFSDWSMPFIVFYWPKIFLSRAYFRSTFFKDLINYFFVKKI